MGKGSARTLKHWLNLGYSENEAEKLRLSRTPGTFEYFHLFKGMTENDAIEAKNEYQSNRANTIDNMTKKYGQIEGEIRWQLYKEKQAYSNSFEYKRDKYSWDIDRWQEYNKKRGHTGELNPMYGTSYYDVWVAKYGKITADHMNLECSKLKVRCGVDSRNFQRKKRPDELEKMKVSAIARIIRQGTATAYNKKSIPIIEQYGKDNGYNFRHAEAGGEYQIPNTTFFVDAYDAEKNVVLEYDEPYHFRAVQLKKDIQRQDFIGNLLKCKFIRIDYKNNIQITNYEN